MKQQLALVIDLGSSSIRSSLYSLPHDGSSLHCLHVVSLPWEAVHAGSICLDQPASETSPSSLLDIVDECIDGILAKLIPGEDEMEVVALGFSSLVMNLIGVDAQGKPVGLEATLSYACNSPEVANKINELRG